MLCEKCGLVGVHRRECPELLEFEALLKGELSEADAARLAGLGVKNENPSGR